MLLISVYKPLGSGNIEAPVTDLADLAENGWSTLSPTAQWKSNLRVC